MWNHLTYAPKLLSLLTYFAVIQAAPASHGVSSEDDITSFLISGHGIAAVLICLVAMVLVLVLVVPGCMDCMNSEVSSENHPACAEGSHKWGGATGYSRANESDPSSGFRSGETVNPNNSSNQPLPYSLIPTAVPEDAGFRGYQSGGDGGLTGYGSAGVRSGGAGDSGPTHYNPMEPEEPPPAYGQATGAQF